LLELDRGKSLTQVATTLNLNYNTIASLPDKYIATGLNCLNDAPRSGRPREIDPTQCAKITALACSDAPDGHNRWSLRLLAEKSVESGICDHISHTFVGEVLKKTN
jgi:transposase